MTAALRTDLKHHQVHFRRATSRVCRHSKTDSAPGPSRLMLVPDVSSGSNAAEPVKADGAVCPLLIR